MATDADRGTAAGRAANQRDTGVRGGDLVSKLQPASWRGINFLVVGPREYSFEHEQARERIIFRDEQLVLSIGRENPGFSYTAIFDETIRTAKWDGLFTRIYPTFLAACKDRSPGDLVDPVHGLRLCKCVSLRETLSPENRFGVTVQVEFVESPDVATSQQAVELPITSLAGAVELGRKLDEEIKKIDWEQEPQPEKSQGLLDSIQAFGDQAGLLQANVNGLLGNTAHRMERLTDTIDRLGNPQLGPTRRSARKLQLASLTLLDSATKPPTPIDVVIKTYEMTKIAFAAIYGMTVEDLHRLNPSLTRVLMVPAGEQITVYRA